MKYSIGINVVPESCLGDLNALLKTIVPVAREMPWSHWVNILRSTTDFITCFDNEKDRVIGMTFMVPTIRPMGSFAEICDTAVLEEYDDLQISPSLIIAAADRAKEKGLLLL